MKLLLKSLARNESSPTSIKTIIGDVEDNDTEEDTLISRTTLYDYLDVLKRLHLIENQESYRENYRLSERVGKSAKRHFTNPSLACAVLNLNADKLLRDLNTFGFMFESLVERF